MNICMSKTHMSRREYNEDHKKADHSDLMCPERGEEREK